MTRLPIEVDRRHPSTARQLLILLAFAAAVRLVVLFGVNAATGGREINDDAHLYLKMARDPLVLFARAHELHEGGIYAPLTPVQLWFPGGFISRWTGPVVGRRLGLLLYDLLALGLALRVAFTVAGPPRGWRQWAAAIVLTILPASVGSSVIWGQEDTTAAAWSAIALACFVWLGPVAAMLVAGAGLFTSKIFFVVLMLGIWLAARGRRTRVAVAGAASVVAFGVFLLARWLASGFFYPDYHYNAISNSPSVWAAYHLLVRPLPWSDEPIRGWVKVVVILGMLAFLAAAWPRRDRLPPWSAVVAAHAAFFACFIGIHPEHYQWFLPFLIVFAWDALVRRRRAFTFLLAVSITCLPYAYKIVYGLRGPEGTTPDGKRAIRDWFERHAGFDLYWVQASLVVVILGSLVALAWQALRRDEGGSGLADASGAPQTTP